MSNKAGFVFRSGAQGKRGQQLQQAAVGTAAAAAPQPEPKRQRTEPAGTGGSGAAAPASALDAPPPPSVDISGFAPTAGAPAESQLLELLQALVAGTKGAVGKAYTGELAYINDAVCDMVSAVEAAAAERIMEEATHRSKAMRMGGAGASASSSLAAHDGRNAVNARNAATLASVKADIAKYDTEIAQWGTVIGKYALPASVEQQSPAKPGEGPGGGRSGAATTTMMSARKRKLPHNDGEAAPAAAAATAAATASQHGGLDPYDIIDDGDDVDEATLAKYGLASSLSGAVASGLDDLITSANAIQAALKSAISTVTASRSVLSSVSTAIRGVSFPGLGVAPGAATATAAPAVNPKALVRNLIASSQPAAVGGAAAKGAAASSASSAAGVSSLSSLAHGLGTAPLLAPSAAASATPTGSRRAAAAAAAAGDGTPMQPMTGGVLGALGSGSRVGVSRPSVPDATPKILAKIQGGKA